jgi:hypothetical protein
MGRSNVLVVAPIGTRRVTQRVWDATLQIIKGGCERNGISYVRISKDNTGLMDTRRYREFRDVCAAAFQAAALAAKPTVIVVDCNNGDGSERLAWEQSLECKLGPDSCHTVLFSPIDAVDSSNEAVLSRTSQRPNQANRINNMQAHEIVNPVLNREIPAFFRQVTMPIKFRYNNANLLRPTRNYIESLFAILADLKHGLKHEVEHDVKVAPWGDAAGSRHHRGASVAPTERVPVSWEDDCGPHPHAAVVRHEARAPCVCHGDDDSDGYCGAIVPYPGPQWAKGGVPVSWEDRCGLDLDTRSHFADILARHIVEKMNMYS